MSHFSELASQIDAAMARDRYRLRQRLRGIEQAGKDGRPFDRNLDRLVRDLEASVRCRAARQTGVPRVTYDPALPITAKIDAIRAAIAEHAVTIVCGETGSGKSTQLPKICLAMGRGVDAMIGHTQPRRIAARSIAARLAEELATPLGQAVGFKIRFTDVTQEGTYVKLMTDGILLAETQQDRFLDQYDTIIIDEAHERSLNIDFLLGYIQRLLPRRPDLRLLITSATIDAERFAAHFACPRTGQPAPIIEVSGRTYPVEIRYRPLQAEGEAAETLSGCAGTARVAGAESSKPQRGGTRVGDSAGASKTQPQPPRPPGITDSYSLELDPLDALDLDQAIARAADELAQTGDGDMLVFLPTERDIREVSKALRGRVTRGDGRPAEILPLYARLSPQEQQKVFQPHAGRRLVLATNVAESSLTVPGIRFVIDTGTARIGRYSPRRKMQRLPIEPVSRASADQRAGRCGRLGPGICIRLYGEDDYLGRDQFTTPEIRRTNLASVILQTKALRLGPVVEFPFLDPPRADAISDGYKTLFELGALDPQQELTDIGRQLARLPVDPRIGRMILAAAQEGCLAEVLIIAAALEVRDPRERPADKQQAADETQAEFADPTSDFLSYLKLWDFYHELRARLSRNQLRKACQQRYLSFNRLREWLDIHRQLKQLVDEANLQPAKPGGARKLSDEARRAAIHRALLTGLLSNVAHRTEPYEYTGAGGHKFFLWPGSGVFDARPPWIVAAELVETTRNFARTVARIEPAWIEPLAQHLVKRSYSEPHWSRRAGSAMAYEKVTLFGLVIVQRRRVPYGPVDPAAAREMLIRNGLIEGDLNTQAKFFARNRALVAEIDRLATKARRSDLFVEEQRQFAFYDARLPADVFDAERLHRWLRQVQRREPRLLCMTRSDLIADGATLPHAEDFPETLLVGPTRLPLEYRFEPGDEADGITLTIPQAALHQLTVGQLGWLVPGLLEEKVVALIRSLPKELRRNFIPAPDVARRVLGEHRFGEGPFLPALAKALKKVGGEPVSPEDFDLDKLPPHLRMNVRVIDDQGKTLRMGRDLAQVQREVGLVAAADAPSLQHPDWHRDGLVAWDFGDWPEHVRVTSGGIVLVAYPMLVDRGEDVSLRLASSPEVAGRHTRLGLRRLCWLAEREDLRSQVAWLPRLDQMKLYAATICGAQDLERQLTELVADRAFLDENPSPANADEFARLLARGRERTGLAVQEVVGLVHPLLEAYHQARLGLEEARSPNWQYAVADMRAQLDRLASPAFLADTPWTWLQHYPRYLRAIKTRLEKLASSGWRRDRQSYEQLAPFLESYDHRAEEHARRGVYDAELQYFRWMLEEFRVSLFAQELGTSFTISAKRLEKQWSKVQA